MLSFPYQDEPLRGSAPPSLPAGTTVRWRPLLPVTIIGPTGRCRLFPREVLDTGSDDTIFPWDVVTLLGIPLQADTGHGLRWQGQPYTLRFGAVALEFSDDSGTAWRWPAVVGFSPARLTYPLLGNAGCLQFLDVRFRGADRVVEVDSNPTYPGTKT